MATRVSIFNIATTTTMTNVTLQKRVIHFCACSPSTISNNLSNRCSKSNIVFLLVGCLALITIAPLSLKVNTQRIACIMARYGAIYRQGGQGDDDGIWL